MPQYGSLRTRILIVGVVLIGAILLLHGLSRAERVPLRRPLHELPLAFAGWQGTDSPLEQRIVDAVGVDEYVNRAYTGPGGSRVQLYIGYYATQRTGDAIHSPKNCLPGAGWEPVRAGKLEIPVPGARPIVVNDYLIRKGSTRLLVLYWYQVRGRAIASEYWAKFWMVHDALVRNRTDGALVRVIAAPSAAEVEAQARQRAIDFVRDLHPRLNEFVPN